MKMSIPHLFRCPISLDLFTDPVTLCTGQTYERLSIERWLAEGHLTCPVTMQRLEDTSLVPNHTLRKLIDRWLLDDLDLNSHSVTDCGTECSLGVLKDNLQSPEVSCGAKLEMLKKLRILSFESDTGLNCLILLGFFQVLLQLLFQYPSVLIDSVLENSEIVEMALELVLRLSHYSHLGYLNMLKKHSNMVAFVLLLNQGNVRIKTSLCYILEEIAKSSATDELCLLIGQLRGVWQVLVSLLNEKFDERASEAAARAVASLCSTESNRPIAVRVGTIDALISLLLSSTQKYSSVVLEILEVLARTEDGKSVLMMNRNAVKVLVKMVFRVSADDHEGSEHAVGLLMILCCNSSRMRTEAVNAGVLVHLLLLLQSQCSSKAKAKARSLLKMFDQYGLKIKEEIYSMKGS